MKNKKEKKNHLDNNLNFFEENQFQFPALLSKSAGCYNLNRTEIYQWKPELEEVVF